MNIMMEEAQRVRFEELVQKSKVYLEFGAGGSTVYASSVCDRVISVESDAEWIETVKKQCFGNVEFFHVDIGARRNYGYPEAGCSEERMREYSRTLLKVPDIQNVDTVFIDGRFRVACALQTFLLEKQPNQILFDDFMNRQHQYGETLNWFDLVDSCVTLGVLKKKDELTLDQEVLRRYEIIPQ